MKPMRRRSVYFATAPFLGDYYRTYYDYTADEVGQIGPTRHMVY